MSGAVTPDQGVNRKRDKPNGNGGKPKVTERIKAEVKERFRGFALPETPNHNFNPARADVATLRRLGLPPRPNLVIEPVRNEMWRAMFARKLHFIQFDVDLAIEQLSDEFRPFYRRNSAGPAAVPMATTRFETSRNWSGASIEVNSDRRFLQVAGQWIVPTAERPAGAGLPEADVQYQSAAWLGVDGERRYRNSSLPQIGTLQAVTVHPDGTETLAYKAWTQWWARDDPDSLPVPVPNFPVDPGDSISCLLTVLTRHRVLLNITNYSYNPPHFAAVNIDGPSITLPNGNKVQLSVSGATAEWIMERPMIPKTTDLAPFADYDCIDFVNCRAFGGAPQDSVLRLQNPKSPRFIRMYDIYQNPPRTRYISMPERIDDSSFRVTYGDFSN